MCEDLSILTGDIGNYETEVGEAQE